MPIDSEFNLRAQEFEKDIKEREIAERKRSYGFNPDEFPSIPTKEEVDRLKGNRAIPSPEPTFDLGGTLPPNIRTQ